MDHQIVDGMRGVIQMDVIEHREKQIAIPIPIVNTAMLGMPECIVRSYVA